MEEEDPNITLMRENHSTDLVLKFHQLLQLERCVDVTLAAEGGSLKAHRLVLSSSSEYFEEILSQQPPDSHVIIILDNISFSELKLLTEYMYKGKVTVNEEELPALLEVASGLKIKGLIDEDPDNENDVVNTSSEPSAARDDLVMSQGVLESAISIQSTSTGNRAPLPALEKAVECLQIVGLMNQSENTDAASNNADQNQLCGSETIDEDLFVHDDQDSMGSFVSIPNVGIPMSKGPEGEEDPLFGETGSAVDGASMEWENTDDGALRHLLANAEVVYPVSDNSTNEPVVDLDEGVQVTPDELKKLKAELQLRQATAKEQDMDQPNNKTMEEPSDTETEGSSRSCDSTDSSLHGAATPSLADYSSDEDFIPSSRGEENNSGEEEEQENSDDEEEFEIDQTPSENVDSDSSDETFEPGKSLSARSSRPKATKPSSSRAKVHHSSRIKKKDVTLHQQPFKCKKCSRSYLQRESLMKHLRLECGKEPQFRCTVCDRRFKQKPNLQAHLVNVHEIDPSQLASYGAGPKVRPVLPFPCTKKCGLSFKSAILMNKHKRLCGVDPSFYCDHCDFSSKWKRSLENHILNIHGAESVK